VDERFGVPELEENLVPIRRKYFSAKFWHLWDTMLQRDRDAFILGWIMELEQLIRRLERRIERIEQREEDDPS
jgi:hypothetical protein